MQTEICIICRFGHKLSKLHVQTLWDGILSIFATQLPRISCIRNIYSCTISQRKPLWWNPRQKVQISHTFVAVLWTSRKTYGQAPSRSPSFRSDMRTNPTTKKNHHTVTIFMFFKIIYASWRLRCTSLKHNALPAPPPGGIIVIVAIYADAKARAKF